MQTEEARRRTGTSVSSEEEEDKDEIQLIDQLANSNSINPNAKPASSKTLSLRAGDKLGNRFQIEGLLGSGAFGKVYLAKDEVTGQKLALKVQKGGRRYSQVAQDEIMLLNVVRSSKDPMAEQGEDGGDFVVDLHGSFPVTGPAGQRQICLALELLGPSLLDLIIDHGYSGIPVPVVKKIVKDVLKGLDHLHRQCDIVHTDVKPENVLLKPPSSSPEWYKTIRQEQDGSKEGRDTSSKLKKGWSQDEDWSKAARVGAKLVDLGNSCFVDRPFTEDIQTIEYRCPEVILGAGFGPSADMWSVACMAFELLTGEYLFDPQEGRNSVGQVTYDKEEDLLALHQELLGKLPKHLATAGRRSEQFMDKEGKLLRIKSLKFWGLKEVLVDKYGLKREEAEEISAFLSPMLRFDPLIRATAAQMLEHPWLQDA